MQCKRSAVGVAALKGRVFICGGYDGVTSLSTGRWLMLRWQWIFRRIKNCQSMFSSRMLFAENGYMDNSGAHDEIPFGWWRCGIGWFRLCIGRTRCPIDIQQRREIRSRCERLDKCDADAESSMSTWSSHTQWQIVRVRWIRWQSISKVCRRIWSSEKCMEIRRANECETKSRCIGREHGKTVGDWRIRWGIEFINGRSLRSGKRHMDVCRTDVCPRRRRWCRSHSNNVNWTLLIKSVQFYFKLHQLLSWRHLVYSSKL